MFKRYLASKNSTITNAFLPNLKTRATGANVSLADTLEVFSIAKQASSSSIEASRILIEFPVNSIAADRTNKVIPASGSVSFFMKLFNAPHAETLPRNFTLLVQPLSSSHQSGVGLDLDNYTDLTYNGVGANWVNAASGSKWTTQGGDFISASYSQTFSQGYEDLEIDISNLVEQWITGSNNGVGVFLPPNIESGSVSYFTKRFFARGSEFFFKRPILEARWDSTLTDDRSRFYISSSLLSQADNTHTLYFYNYFKGQLKNIPSIQNNIYLQVYTSASLGELVPTTPTVVTGGYVSTGTYSASFVLNATASTYYDRWFNGAQSYHTGSFNAVSYDSSDKHIKAKKYVVNLTNLKPKYSILENVRLNLFVRENNWNPTIYNVSSKDIENTVLDNVYFKILRLSDNTNVVDYGTGSQNHTKLSFDSDGNYFLHDFSYLEPNYTYGFKFGANLDGNFEEFSDIFKFKVVE